MCQNIKKRFCLPETKNWDYPLSVLFVKKILVSSGFFFSKLLSEFQDICCCWLIKDLLNIEMTSPIKPKWISFLPWTIILANAINRDRDQLYKFFWIFYWKRIREIKSIKKMVNVLIRKTRLETFFTNVSNRCWFCYRTIIGPHNYWSKKFFLTKRN